MQASINLLGKALEAKSGAEWGRVLGVTRSAMHSARIRGNLSPALAFGMAEELGENPLYWATVAAAEGEKDSKARDRMIKALSKFGTANNP